jgi:hypothetical protein
VIESLLATFGEVDQMLWLVEPVASFAIIRPWKGLLSRIERIPTNKADCLGPMPTCGDMLQRVL